MMWLMIVILRVVVLIETVLLFFTCVTFLSPFFSFVSNYALTIHTLIGRVKNYTHTFREYF